MRVNLQVMRNSLSLAVVLGLFVAGARVTAQAPDIKPGPEHAVLKQSVGTWDATVRSQGNKESKGTANCKMGMNGLWMLEHFKTEIDGKPFEGAGAISYDQAKKKYINVWIDSLSTTPMISEGTYDKATKTMTFGFDIPMPDGKAMKATTITVYRDPETKTFTLNGAGPDGKGFEMLHITYKRRTQ